MLTGRETFQTSSHTEGSVFRNEWQRKRAGEMTLMAREELRP